MTFRDSENHFSQIMPDFCSKTSSIVNCIGVTRPLQRDHTSIDRLIRANIVIPYIINRTSARFGIPALHISTTDLDFPHEDFGERLDCDMDIATNIATSSIWNRLIKDSDPYVLSKALLESLCEQWANSRVIRVSNIFGPGYKRDRLIPRIILGRLRGETVSLPSETRNWSYRDELNEFFVWVLDFASNADRLMWAYGSYDLAVEQIVQEVKYLLPTCYGDFEITPSNNERPHPKRRISDYMPRIALPSLREALWETCRYLRVHCSYSLRDFVSVAAPENDPMRGGSIAQKSVDANGNITKIARHPGFEGAGIAKIRAEIEFYKRLQSPDQTDLRELYPRMIRHHTSETEARITLAMVGNGLTVAHAMAAGKPFPDIECAQLLDQMFRASYLRDLQPLNDEEGRWLLSCLYLGRAHDRLRRFFSVVASEPLGHGLLKAITLLSNGGNLVIDGVEFPNPLTVLERIERSEALGRLFSPRATGRCGHGDVTILNMVHGQSGGSLRLIDPRGCSGYWDPAYDLSKFAFSLSGFAACLTGTMHCRVADCGFELKETDTAQPAHVARRWFDSWLATEPTFDPLRAVEPNLGWRIRLGEATHYLADVVYRYAQGRDSDTSLAILLLGIRQLGTLAHDMENELQA